jgi:hypothetical protein
MWRSVAQGEAIFYLVEPPSALRQIGLLGMAQ